MADKTKKSIDDKKILFGFFTIAIVICAFIITTLFIIKNNPIDESFFVSDNTKYVLTIDPASLGSVAEEYIPEKVRLVYFYSGEKITDLKTYYRYENEETAKQAADFLKSADLGEEIKNITVNGNYIIITASNSAYENMTASDAKQQIELMEVLQNMNFDNDANTIFNE